MSSNATCALVHAAPAAGAAPRAAAVLAAAAVAALALVLNCAVVWYEDNVCDSYRTLVNKMAAALSIYNVVCLAVGLPAFVMVYAVGMDGGGACRGFVLVTATLLVFLLLAMNEVGG